VSPRVAQGLAAHRRLLQRERLLPAPGQVLVSLGQQVGPDDVVGRTVLPSQPFALPVPGLEEGAADPSVRLVKQVGDVLAAGEVVAVKKGFLGRGKPICRSAEEGTLTAIVAKKGMVIVTPPPSAVELRAGVSGQVVHLVPEYGAVLEFAAVYAQGLAMVGGETWGPLRAGAAEPDGPLLVPEDAGDCVLFAGRADDKALAEASKAGVRGLVLGSLPAETWLRLAAGQFPGPTVMLVEAVGCVPLGERTFRALEAAAGCTALLSPGPGRWRPEARPEIVVSLPEAGSADQAEPQWRPGAEVRLAAGPLVGRWGRLASADPLPRRLESGVVCLTAEVILAGGQQTVVPLANLELVG